MSVTFNQIEEQELLQTRQQVFENYSYLDNFDLETAIRFHKSLPDYKNFQKKIEKLKKENKISMQAYSKETLLEDIIKNLNTLHRVGQANFLSVVIDSHTRENNYESAKRALEDSMKSNKGLLNGFPMLTYGVKLSRKIVNDTEVPLQVKHGSPDPRLLIEVALLAGFSSFDGGGISHNIPFSKSVSLKESLEFWKYTDRLVGFYEKNGISINREIFSTLTATLVPPAISNSIQILETLLAVEQGVKNVTLGVAQYGNIAQDIATLIALKEQAEEYLKRFSFNDINISTIFNEWVGGFPNDELKSYSLISYAATIGIFSNADRIFVKNPEEYEKNSMDNTMINSLLLTKAILEITDCQKVGDYSKINFEKEQIKRETAQILEKIFSLSTNLSDAIVKAFEEGIIDVPFAPSKYNLGKMMPARDIEGAIRYIDFGNLPFDDDTKKFHHLKIKERAEKENREVDFQMTIDDIFAISQGKLMNR